MIHRAEYDKDYTRVKNGFVNDESLSFEAKGFMLFILSLPDDWNFSTKGLAYKTKLSIYTVSRLVKELREAGYIVQKRTQNEHGQFGEYEWQIYDLPELREGYSPSVVKTERGENRERCKPSVVKSPHKQITNNNKELNITNDSLEQKGLSKKFKPPTVEEVRSYCEERKNGIDPEAFCDFYTSKGWKVGKDSMKDWKAAVRTWEKRNRPKPIKNSSGNEFTQLLEQEGFSI